MKSTTHNNFDVKIYPNPFQSYLVLEINNDIRHDLTIEIISVTDLKVKTTSFSTEMGINEIRIDHMETQPKGVYYLRILDENNNNLGSFPIIKQ